eukprot:CAMPEP_0184328158 /NCGR_PEP_ID=MMETSP1049-20130417/143474_1 /TAXON_ID=77928 /ORGANISM="Proteomonas sulcata, Strain CCMP704" /LENGTH=248 /DNA_ID=CAMNT_0026650453 /DNA_START=641 /DNA_END=1387 /DNA_ORIENTATION=+
MDEHFPNRSGKYSYPANEYRDRDDELRYRVKEEGRSFNPGWYTSSAQTHRAQTFSAQRSSDQRSIDQTFSAQRSSDQTFSAQRSSDQRSSDQTFSDQRSSAQAVSAERNSDPRSSDQTFNDEASSAQRRSDHIAEAISDETSSDQMSSERSRWNSGPVSRPKDEESSTQGNRQEKGGSVNFVKLGLYTLTPIPKVVATPPDIIPAVEAVPIESDKETMLSPSDNPDAGLVDVVEASSCLPWLARSCRI